MATRGPDASDGVDNEIGGKQPKGYCAGVSKSSA
jgi:hypothetical protein